jgi:hypothetical protein
MAADTQQTLADFRAGKFQHQSAENAIAALRQSLQEHQFQPISPAVPD